MVKLLLNWVRARPRNSLSMRSRNCCSPALAFTRFDAADGVDLVRLVAAVVLFEAVEERPQHAAGEKHEADVARHGDAEDQEQRDAVGRHEREVREDLNDGQQPHQSALHDELADLPRAGEAALDVRRCAGC